MEVKIRANCKINIGLNVIRRRPDGYHDLETVMYPVSGLFDDVALVRSDISGICQEGDFIPDCPDEKNLCMKALRLMQRRFGAGEAMIRLHKRVPFGAGLGGGSADAAAVIVAADRLFGLGLSEEEMLSAAAELGSDVPFFVRNTPQLCSGRGEIMSPLELPLAGHCLVLLKPEEGVSTAEAYAGVRPAEPQVPLRDALSLPVAEWDGRVVNDFEPHIFAAHPAIASLKELLVESGAEYASMSGSGSAVYGIFSDKPELPPAAVDGLFMHIQRL